jgi:hypothetical protein
MVSKFCKSTWLSIVAASSLVTLGFATFGHAQSAEPSLSQLPNRAPRIVATSPKVGDRDVDPAVKEITVTFDRDMDSGFSWTGSGPNFPTIPEGARPHWRDSRTCVLPVELKSGHDYRVGINSMSYHGFSGTNGLPTAVSAIYFTTSGPKTLIKTPEIVSLEPANGATDVSPAVAELRVTFNVPMGRGMSWCGGGPNFPTTPDGQKAHWTDDGKTCVLPVQLKPGWEYHLGINCPSFKNFRSDEGVPLVPVGYTFKTSDP